MYKFTPWKLSSEDMLKVERAFTLKACPGSCKNFCNRLFSVKFIYRCPCDRFGPKIVAESFEALCEFNTYEMSTYAKRMIKKLKGEGLCN